MFSLAWKVLLYMYLFSRFYFTERTISKDELFFFSYRERIYIPLTLPLKECIQVRTKLSEGQLFTFRDRQDSCLPSAARLDSPEDQGKGKVGPRKVLFLQEYNFLQG